MVTGAVADPTTMTLPASAVCAGTRAVAEVALRWVCTTMPTTTASTRTTAATAPPIIDRRRRSAWARAAASAARFSAIRRCAAAFLAPGFPSAGTRQLLLSGRPGEDRLQREPRPRPPRQAQRDDQQPDVPDDLPRVGGLPGGDLTAVAEAPAVDLQATSPGGTD